MKKFLAIIAIAGSLAACNSSSDKKEDSKDTSAVKMDTTAPKMDTAAPKMDTAAMKPADTSKPK